MEKYLIYTDSAADMPAHLYNEFDIGIIPMSYVVNGEELEFRTDSSDHDKICDALFEAQKNGADVHTSQITPAHYISAFDEPLKNGNDILYLCFSSGMSATYDNANLARNELLEKYPERKLIIVDTMAATQGQGIFTYSALLNRKNGMTIEENEAWLLEKRPFLCHRFMVGDLDYLHKGGRISKASAVMGSMLNIKPIIIIDDEGKLQVVGKIRGAKLAVKNLMQTYLQEQGVEGVPKVIYIGHTSLYEDAEKLKEAMAKSVDKDTVIEVVNLSPIIGSHIGSYFFSICGWGFHRDVR